MHSVSAWLGSPGIAFLLWVFVASPVEAGLCELADLCPQLDPVPLCEAQHTCSEIWFVCIQECVHLPGSQVQACVDGCGLGFVSCGVGIYPPGADCYPCAFDPDLCANNCADRPELAVHEGWESAAPGEYIAIDAPDTVTQIGADMGRWIVEDTISSFPECGPTPQRATILEGGEGRTLRLDSVDTGSECADNVWVELRPSFPPLGNQFRVPFDAQTQISFREDGILIAPQSGSPFCLAPPCGDTVSLRLSDRFGNTLAYVFQRALDAEPNQATPIYREIFLDPTSGSEPRFLHQDFSTIPAFVENPDPCGASIESIVFEVDAPGTATLDELCIDQSCPPIVIPEPRACLAGPAALISLVLVGRLRRRSAGQRCSEW